MENQNLRQLCKVGLVAGVSLLLAVITVYTIVTHHHFRFRNLLQALFQGWIQVVDLHSVHRVRGRFRAQPTMVTVLLPFSLHQKNRARLLRRVTTWLTDLVDLVQKLVKELWSIIHGPHIVFQIEVAACIN